MSGTVTYRSGLWEDKSIFFKQAFLIEPIQFPSKTQPKRCVSYPQTIFDRKCQEQTLYRMYLLHILFSSVSEIIGGLNFIIL